MRKYLSVPSDFKKSTIDYYNNCNNKFNDFIIHETYGQISTLNNFGSVMNIGLIPSVTLEKLEKYINYSKKNKILFNYTFNNSCLNNIEYTKEGHEAIINFLTTLEKIGVKKITVTLPAIVDIIKEKKFKFFIKASSICNIDHPEKAIAYKKNGVNQIVLPSYVNRDFPLLCKMVKTNMKPVVIINSFCNKFCIYRQSHYNQLSHYNGKNKQINYFFKKCTNNLVKNKVNFLKINWIRPEDIHYYEKIGIQYYKIQGRQVINGGNIKKVVKHYLNKNYNGNLINLLLLFNNKQLPLYINNKNLDKFIDYFISNKNPCENSCSECGYCDKFLKYIKKIAIC